VAAAAGSTLGVALLASLFASWRTTRIDPAEALRYE
jgi:ABC-type lipoprotein release transport system permease subunit